MNKLIILDRDGVINEDSDAFIKTDDECIPIPGSIDAIARLYKAGYQIVVATNQSGIARGLFDELALARIHQSINDQVEALGGMIAGFFYCPHGPDDNCLCRKPLPGLVHQIAQELNISVANVPFVGDSLRDLQAGQSAGCQPVLVLTGKGSFTVTDGLPAPLADTAVYDDLAAFANSLIKSDS
ncbi:MAG: D-glycero-beta-D-manno-heptose-1,7-bisphosphate 7-phosphatase [Gammaproteobacteria bacterium]|nr:D-glycero-beta-D-manno-heptose-1,7-bisphosphate 7-phosphatase [Gammaproteobacteria bacterium]|tara:strand:- start:1152 stop:1703 length:552 start_codon:yes stop_codon:yes gene_type:complete